MNIIETSGLTRRFRRTEAVQDLNLAVPTGSIFALLGPNGAGKTTTLKLLMNLLEPTAGIAEVLGTNSRRLGERELAQIGYVSENQQLPRWMTVRQFLDYCRPFYPTWDAALEKALLTKFALPLDRKLAQLSRGMLMKAALLSSLAYRPKLLVLDEPFSGLDPLVRDEFVQGMLEITEGSEWTIVVSSHDIAEVEQLCDHVAMLDGGRLQFSEPKDALQARFRRVEVLLGDAAPRLEQLPSHWIRLERAGSLVRFVDQNYRRNDTEAECRARFSDAAVTASPMSLREIFIALAQEGRTSTQGATP